MCALEVVNINILDGVEIEGVEGNVEDGGGVEPEGVEADVEDGVGVCWIKCVQVLKNPNPLSLMEGWMCLLLLRCFRIRSGVDYICNPLFVESKA